MRGLKHRGVIFERLEHRQHLSAVLHGEPSGTPLDGTNTLTIISGSPPPLTFLDAGDQPLPSGSTFDFGTVVVPGNEATVTKVLNIRNDGSDPITISPEFPPSGFGGQLFSMTGDGTTIQPGAIAAFNVTLNTHIIDISYGEQTLNLPIGATDATTDATYADTPTVDLTADIVAPTVGPTLTVSSHKAAVFKDVDGNQVKVSLSGPGTASVQMRSSGNSNIGSILTNGTTFASTLTITPLNRNAHTSITGLIDITGNLGRFIAPRVDLVGDSGSSTGSTFETSAGLKTLALGNITGLQTINVYGYKGTPLDFTAGDVSDSVFSSGGPLSVHVNSWTDTGQANGTSVNGGHEQVIAPRLSNLTCKGDFTVGVYVTNNGSIKQAAIGGSLGNDPWIVTGNVYSLRTGAINSAFSATIGAELDSLHVAHDDSGTIAAGRFGRITVGGNLSGAKLLAGVNLGLDGIIGAATSSDADTFAAGSIASLVVDGSATDAIITAGFQPTDGLFDNTAGALLGGKKSVIDTINIKGGVDANTRFVAGAIGTARVPQRVNAATDSRFVVLT